MNANMHVASATATRMPPRDPRRSRSARAESNKPEGVIAVTEQFAAAHRSLLRNALRRALVFASFAAICALVPAPVAAVAQPASSGPTPPPPAFLTCNATGGGTICSGTRERVEDPTDTGIVCGVGADAFSIFDQGLEHQRLTLWYDRDGNIARVLNHERWDSSAWSNPVTGTMLPYTQSNVITTEFAVPGDFNSATETTVGELVFTDPSTGKKVLRSVGRSVVSPVDGTVLFLAGKQPFFSDDAAVFDPVCAALTS